MKLPKNIFYPVECFYCGTEMFNKFEHTFDHIVPLSAGGKNTLDNVVDCCFRCNQLKANKSVDEFETEIYEKLKGINNKAPQYNYFMAIFNKLQQIKL